MKTSQKPHVLSWQEVLQWRKSARERGLRVVLTNGCFDLLHRGHFEYLSESSTLADLLLVAVNSDVSVRELKGAKRPVNGEVDRAFALSSLRCVDAAFVFPGPRLAAEILDLRPDVYTKAGDYTLESLDVTERMALETVGANIKFIPFTVGHSTTNTINRMAE
jgi:rfaE bifunctional protein nucleotidyltransferase chain/domain